MPPPTGIHCRLAEPERAAALLTHAASLRSIEVEDRTASDLELLGNGGFTPLTGFLCKKDYESVVRDMRLADGQPWSVPITLPVRREEAASFKEGDEVALRFRGQVIAILHLQEKFEYDREAEARGVWRTTDPAHPGVAGLLRQGEIYFGGEVLVLVPDIHTDFGQYRMTPTQTRAAFKERGWERVVAFQTRNPIHRAHEYLQKCALEMVDGILVHPLVGETKGDDIPADVRMRCYEVLLDKYYPRDRTMLSVFPAAMRYAGPREAVFHALVRRNYGCTHFIVGRDHAGVGNYYGSYDAQKIFSEFKPGELGIQTIFFDHTFYCRACGHMASEKTCVHDKSFRVAPSGTKVREMLRAGRMLPTEFTRPEVARVLLEAYHPEMREARRRREEVQQAGGGKVVVLGLDGAPPSLVFDRWKDELPNLAALARRGVHGPLRSTRPPVTVPAWSSMLASRDPGELGIYGFRNRRSNAYDDNFFAHSGAVKEKRAFELLSDAGKYVATVGVPGTYPPRPVHGIQVGDFMTPDTGAEYTHPGEFKEEIDRVVGRYILDVQGMRGGDRDVALGQIYEMTQKRFRLAEHILTTKPWEFFMMVEMGPDRMQHLFWRDFDESHPRHVKGSAHANALRDYYKFLDHQIGDLLKLLDPDTHVVVVSDHGAQSSHGAVAVNQWLLDNGWLVLKGAAPTEPTPLSKLSIDWSRTKAWAEGGYYARIYLNLKGREPEGIIGPEAAEDEKAALAEALRTAGGDLGHEVYRPEDVYAATRGVPPDLIVHFGALRWRAEARVGFKEILLRDAEGAGDDVGHHEDGIFLMAGPGTTHRAAAMEGLEIYDVGPTLLRLMGEPVPAAMRGRVIG